MIEPAPGILLIADPFLKDPNFLRSVVLLCEHEPVGSFGFVLNRQYLHTLDELVTTADDLKLPVFYGGPVQKDTIHFLHQYPQLIPGSNEILKGVHWGGDFETAVTLLRNGDVLPEKIRFYIGYSGWSEGQLNEELKEKAWLTAAAKSKLIFHTDVNEIWKDAIRLLGSDFEPIINYPIDPQLN